MNITTPAYHILADKERRKFFCWARTFFCYLGPAWLRHMAIALPYIIAAPLATLLGSDHGHFHGLISGAIMLWLRPPPQIFLVSSISSLISQFVFARIGRVFTAITDFCRAAPKPPDSDTMDGFLKPMLWSSHTSQASTYPQTRSLSYSYLLAGIPATSSSLSYGSLLSSHETSYPLPPAWFSVHARDHLQHGSSFANHSLRAKLDAYLTSQNIDPSTYPAAYLITAPRFLGLTLNTISFWYLYTTTRQLSLMVLEVRNSVEGRQIYLLRPHRSKKTTGPDSGGEVFQFEWQQDPQIPGLWFKDPWKIYSASTVDVASTGSLDITIELWNSSGNEGKAKVVSRVRSIPLALTRPSPPTAICGTSGHNNASFSSGIGHDNDLLSLTVLQRFKLLLQYGGISCRTNLWMLTQAWSPWRRYINESYNAGPIASLLCSTETPQETAIEKAFRSLLDTLANRAGMTTSYISAAGAERHATVLSGAVNHVHNTSIQDTVDQDPRELLHIHVLSPKFYTEMARANGKLIDVFGRFCFCASPTETLISISDERLMRKLLAFMPDAEIKNTMAASTNLSTKAYRLVVLWTRAVSQLGRLRALQAVSLLRVQALQQGQEADLPLVWSELDSWMIGRLEEAEYFHAVLAIVLADRIAMGSTMLLRLQWRAMRALVVVLLTPVFCKVLVSWFGILDPDYG